MNTKLARNPNVQVRTATTDAGVEVTIIQNGTKERLSFNRGQRATKAEADKIVRAFFGATPAHIDTPSRLARYINHAGDDALRGIVPTGHLWQARHVEGIVDFTQVAPVAEASPQDREIAEIRGEIRKLTERLDAFLARFSPGG